MEAIKFKLSTKREVVMKMPQVGDQELAAERAGDIKNPNSYALAIQNELVKLLLYSVDGEKLTGAKKQNIKALFTLGEYSEIILALGEALPKPEIPKLNVVTIEE